MTRPLLIAMMVLTTGCTNPFSMNERLETLRALDRWKSTGIASYTFQTRASCFCGSEHLTWATVTVHQHQVVGVTLESGAMMSASRFGEWPTIDQLFNLLLASQSSAGLEDIRVRFDPQWGFPIEIEHVAKKNVQDGGSIRYVRQLTPMILAL